MRPIRRDDPRDRHRRLRSVPRPPADTSHSGNRSRRPTLLHGLQLMHSGLVGDYVAWIVVGVAGFTVLVFT